MASDIELQQSAMEMLEKEQVIVEGHFVYTKGGHGDAYVQKDRTIRDPELLAAITGLMADKLMNNFDPAEIDAIIGIAPCSSALAARTAEHIGVEAGRTPQIAFAEKYKTVTHNVRDGYVIEEGLTFKRGFDTMLKGLRVVLLEDVVNSGGSLVQLRDLVRKLDDVEIFAGTAEWDRSPKEVTPEALDVGLWLPLVEKPLAVYAPDECPMCEDLDQYPIRTDLGHGAEFLARQTN